MTAVESSSRRAKRARNGFPPTSAVTASSPSWKPRKPVRPSVSGEIADAAKERARRVAEREKSVTQRERERNEPTRKRGISSGSPRRRRAHDPRAQGSIREAKTRRRSAKASRVSQRAGTRADSMGREGMLDRARLADVMWAISGVDTLEEVEGSSTYAVMRRWGSRGKSPCRGDVDSLSPKRMRPGAVGSGRPRVPRRVNRPARDARRRSRRNS